MNSRAGSGEYSSTSTGPSRSASAAIAPRQRGGVADVGGRVRGGDALAASSPASPVELGRVARDQADGHPFAPEAAGDGQRRGSVLLRR